MLALFRVIRAARLAGRRCRHVDALHRTAGEGATVAVYGVYSLHEFDVRVTSRVRARIRALHSGRPMAIKGERLAPKVDSNHARLVCRLRDIEMYSYNGSPRSVEESHIGAAHATHTAASNARCIADAPAAQ